MDELLKEKLMSGKMTTCPTCDRVVKLYRRSIHSNMLKCLRILNEATKGMLPSELVRTSAGSYDRGDYAKLRYWGLVEQDSEKKWRITEKGQHFLRGEIVIPKYVFIYNREVHGFSAETVSIHDKFEGFDLEVLLAE